MRLIISGGRDYQEQPGDREFLDSVHLKHGITTVLCGGARGADALGSDWARSRGIPVVYFRPDWSQHGRGAGLVRNTEMAAEAEVLVAFPGGAGTSDMVRKAETLGLVVIRRVSSPNELSTRWIDESGAVADGCAVFFRVNEEFGALSNMAGGFPLDVCGSAIPSSEALYQACRFPSRPEIQREIISQHSAMAAKMKAKKDRRREQYSRPDWEEVRVEVMRWCLRVKLVQNFGEFFEALLATKQRAIVEKSRKDRFWGAVQQENGVLRGENRLGRLLVEVRREVQTWLDTAEDDAPFPTVLPPAIEDFRLLGEQIGPIEAYAKE